MNLSLLNNKINAKLLEELPLVVDMFKIDNPKRLAHFLSQCSHESANFTAVRENLNYSADALLRVFPKYFKDKATADLYGRNPEKIANKVYGNRMGNGDEASGDGFRFRGRGYIQLTGKDNYSSFDKFVADDILLNPDLVATKYPLLSAAFFFHRNNLNAIADKGVGKEDVVAMTKRINGGQIGIDHRLKEFDKFKGILLA